MTHEEPRLLDGGCRVLSTLSPTLPQRGRGPDRSGAGTVLGLLGGFDEAGVEGADVVGVEVGAEEGVLDADFPVEVELGAGGGDGLGGAGFADAAEELTLLDAEARGNLGGDGVEVAVAGDDAVAVVDPDLAAAVLVQCLLVGVAVFLDLRGEFVHVRE